MSKPSARKMKRRRTRKQREDKRHHAYSKRCDAMSRFPDFYLQHDNPPEELADAVLAASRYVSANHEKLLPERLVQMCRFAKNEGFPAVCHTLKQMGSLSYAGLAWSNAVSEMQSVLYAAIPDSVRKRHFPFHDLQLLCGYPQANTVTINIRALKQAKTPGGIAYFSPLRTKVRLPDGPRIAAFYRHAVFRICERTAGNLTTHWSFGNGFMFLHDCIYHQPWVATDGPGFILYEECIRPLFSSVYVAEILGETASLTKRYFYRVGYCPAVISGEFLVAKTLLLPGMQGTPEYDWYLHHVGQSAADRSTLYEQASNLTRQALIETGDFRLLRRFHYGGIPQVVEFSHDIVCYIP